MKLKIVAAVAAGAVALAIVTANAQMHHGSPGSSGNPMPQRGPGMMQQHGQHGPGMMQGGAQHGSMHQGSGAGPHGGHQNASMPKGDRGPASLAFHGINAKMHEGMDIAFTGNTDADFVRGMIPHHEGAVEMAKVVLAFGKDAEVRKLAEGIIKAQEDEIAWMKAWLAKNAR